MLGCIAISAVVFGAGLLMGNQSARELFLVAVALAVAAIPEGLPAVTTIVLALGTQRMAKRNALVRRLPAVETLGCAQVICTDKTGTLTQNAMTARRVWVAGRAMTVSGDPRKLDGELKAIEAEPAETDLQLVLECASWASGAHLSVAADSSVEIQGDPTDAALKMMARRVGVEPPGHLLSEQPFTSQRRMASVMAHVGGRARVYVRGAPEVLLERAVKVWRNGHAVAITDADKQAITAEAAAWAEKTMRVIGLCIHEGMALPVGPATPSPDWETGLTFVGLVGIVDPPRPEVAPAIAEARRAGIRTVMITGDHPATARAIAEEIGLWNPANDIILTGSELDHLDQQALEERIDKVAVVARATAEHKLRIVQALKARGFICAMTGDGVNDAPAVKAASIGVAMGKAGTDVTKEAAAMVLADDNYATIVAAVEEGRAIYANIRTFIFFLLSSNAGCVIVRVDRVAAGLGGAAGADSDSLDQFDYQWIAGAGAGCRHTRARSDVGAAARAGRRHLVGARIPGDGGRGRGDGGDRAHRLPLGAAQSAPRAFAGRSARARDRVFDHGGGAAHAFVQLPLRAPLAVRARRVLQPRAVGRVADRHHPASGDAVRAAAAADLQDRAARR